MPPKKKRKILTTAEVIYKRKIYKSFWIKKIMKILLMKMPIYLNFVVRKYFCIILSVDSDFGIY